MLFSPLFLHNQSFLFLSFPSVFLKIAVGKPPALAVLQFSQQWALKALWKETTISEHSSVPSQFCLSLKCCNHAPSCRDNDLCGFTDGYVCGTVFVFIHLKTDSS